MSKALVTTLTTLAGVVLTAPASAVEPPRPAAPVADEDWGAESSPLMHPARAVRYWTAGKQAKASTAELPEIRLQPVMGAGRRSVPTSKRITPGGDANGYARVRRPYTGAATSRITGRLFYVNASGRDDSCSASVVRSAAELLVVTAAHCVYGVPPGSATGQWHTNFAFVPAYDGRADTVRQREPYGRWGARRAWKPDGYTGLSGGDWNSPYDIALIEVGKKNDRTLQDAVGAFTPMLNEGGRHTITTTGYPGIAGRTPYDGRDQLWCLGHTEPAGGLMEIGGLQSSGLRATSSGGRMETHNCHLFKGHSGGPWLLKDTHDLVGVLSAGTEDGIEVGYSVATALNAEGYGAIVAHADPRGVYDALSVKAAGPRRAVKRGGTATVTATVTMRGLMSAAQVPVTFTLPEGTSLTSVHGAPCKRTSRQATCTIAAVRPGRPVRLTARVRVGRGAGRSPRVTAHVDSTRLDPSPSDNTSAVRLPTR
ncbi:trypsin-like serine protease [Nonomuraea phyllanthi]|uniref:Trypsin-like serine protease n=1 Tax=Nonomuraea phyllanthi TaxID=2219224 RepID=A0A5C4V960_9ACTN|nr:trypsin-like peptidase domain-containing protein [Nonomuraea phyllanthi]KAB8188265.1 trypsin-like serine protease [Nonomuraea phyllanthi]